MYQQSFLQHPVICFIGKPRKMYEYSPDQSKLCHLRLNSTLTKSLLISNWYKIDTEILWDDPFDSIWLKLFTVIVYLVEIMSSIIMLAFVVYETNGLAGHYRTLINQLLSYHYGAVRVFPILIFGQKSN